MAFWDTLGNIADGIISGITGRPTNSSLQAQVTQQRALLESYQNTLQELTSSVANAYASSADIKRYLLYGGMVIVVGGFAYYLFKKGRAF